VRRAKGEVAPLLQIMQHPIASLHFSQDVVRAYSGFAG
jgi:hypothetical protein